MDNLELLEHLGAVEPPTEAVVLRANAMLEAEIARTVTMEAIDHTAEKSPTSRWHSRALVGVTIVVVLAAAAIGVSSNLPGGSPSAAASVLRRLARVALVQTPAAVPGPDQYLYMRYESSYLHKAPTAGIGASPSDGSQESYTYFQIDREQVWASSSRYGEWIEDLGPPTFLSPADTAAWVADGSPTIPTGISASKLGPDPLYAAIPTLPTDPVELGKWISSRRIESGPPGPAEDFVQVGDLLRESDAPPAVRAALFEYAATIPGVVALGTVSDHDGRFGAGLGFIADGLRTDLIFDPGTSVLLGEDETIEAGSSLSYPVGTVFSWTVYLSSSVVDAMPSIASLAAPPLPPQPMGAGGKKL